MGKLLKSSLILLLMCFTAQAQLSGPLSGVLAGNTTYTVIGDISVERGDSLIIQPGAILVFNQSTGFDIGGYIIAAGTEEDSIKFINRPGMTWERMKFDSSACDSSKLEYCLITGGSAEGSWPYNCGGGIYICSSNPRITNCSINNNAAGSGGGGIFCLSANPIITNCDISSNMSEQGGGGGIKCDYYSSPTITNCLIKFNMTYNDGGGIFCHNHSSPIIDNCIIDSDTAGDGGGIECDSYSDPTISDCIISGNRALDEGGGICCEDDSYPIITNCVIRSNSAVSVGGGFFSYFGSNPYIMNCVISGNTTASHGGGISCILAYLTVKNTIVEGNFGNAGVYLENSLGVAINYSDFYNNQNGNFNIAPPGVGYLVAVNTNGDSCDPCHNIYLDPEFYSLTGDSAFYLTANSPCIDAGAPNSMLDPDSTIADIGTYYYDQSGTPQVSISLTPVGLPIIIPAAGGAFEFNTEIANNGTAPQNVDIWSMAILPNGTAYGPIIFYPNFNVPANWSGSRDRNQNIPAIAPAGNYTYNAYIGIYPNIIWDEDHFDFSKSAAADARSDVKNWLNWGEDLWTENDPAPLAAENYDILSVYPNPFNAATTISFEMGNASLVSLRVYDVQGREVDCLKYGQLAAGKHEFTFDGSGLSSGIYFAKLEAGDFTQTVKLLLMK